MRNVWFRGWVLMGIVLLAVPSHRLPQYDQGWLGFSAFVLQTAVLLPVNAGVSLVQLVVPPSTLSGLLGTSIALLVAWGLDRSHAALRARRQTERRNFK